MMITYEDETDEERAALYPEIYESGRASADVDRRRAAGIGASTNLGL